MLADFGLVDDRFVDNARFAGKYFAQGLHHHRRCDELGIERGTFDDLQTTAPLLVHGSPLSPSLRNRVDGQALPPKRLREQAKRRRGIALQISLRMHSLIDHVFLEWIFTNQNDLRARWRIARRVPGRTTLHQ